MADIPRRNSTFSIPKQEDLMPDAAKASIPIVALTANAFEEDRKKAFEAGMNGHLAKPIDIAKLQETLIGILRKQ